MQELANNIVVSVGIDQFVRNSTPVVCLTTNRLMLTFVSILSQSGSFHNLCIVKADSSTSRIARMHVSKCSLIELKVRSALISTTYLYIVFKGIPIVL